MHKIREIKWTAFTKRRKSGINGNRNRVRTRFQYADLAHLVERHLAKVEVASSSLVIRSNLTPWHLGCGVVLYGAVAKW